MPISTIQPFEPLGLPSLMVNDFNHLLRDVFNNLNLSNTADISLRALSIRVQDLLFHKGAIEANVIYHIKNGWKNGKRCPIMARFDISYCMPDGTTYTRYEFIKQ